eukprot:Colp12_sorted_trinity150504_noHs@33448
MNGRIIKEPRGLIKILEIIFSIFAFATTAGEDYYPFFTEADNARFFVAVGVISFIYCLLILVAWVFTSAGENDLVKKGDFAFTIIWSIMWLIASAIWASKVKDSTGQLKASVTFGFLCLVLYLGDIWFAFKDVTGRGTPAQNAAAV